MTRSEFAEECVAQGLYLKVNSHYLTAVAQLRSGIQEVTNGDKIGPFQVTRDAWEALNTVPDMEFSLLPTEIDKWRSQILFAGASALRVQSQLITALGRNPSALELYKAQFPDDGSPEKLQQACDDTVQLYLDAVNAVVPPGDPKPEKIADASATPPPLPPIPPPAASGGQFGTLLDFIGKAESGGNYNAYFGHGKNQGNPTLVTKSVGDLLAWQKRYTDGGSPSSAAGKYQIIRKTLAALRDGGTIANGEIFNQATQDKLGVALLEQRGLRRYMANAISDEDFALSVAKEWASMPVPRDVFNGKRNVRAGQSFYAGDGLNMALVRTVDFLEAIRSLRS